MKKLLTVAALGMFCISGMAQDAKKDEGFVNIGRINII